MAQSHRRRGIARAMLREAIQEARGLGFEEVRLYTGNPDAGRLFSAEGFRLLTDCSVWTARRVEGGDPPRLAAPSDAPRLAERLSGDPALAAYGGVVVDWHGTLDVSVELLEHLAERGLVRMGAGGRSLALIREWPRRRFPITFLAGSGTGAEDLLMGLRFEADSQGLDGVAVLAPADHPAAEDLAEAGYDLAEDEGHAYVYALKL